jgi:hypothetical protein
MTSTARWYGLWRDGFEAQLFCAFPAKHCASITGQTWIEFSGERPKHDKIGGLYAIDFIGRHTARKGYYGMGADHAVVVDQILSIELIEPPPPPPPPPTEAQINDNWMRCVASRNCIPSPEKAVTLENR